MSTIVAELELDLEVFTGPFDLLLTLVLREEVDLLEVELADARGYGDLKMATANAVNELLDPVRTKYAEIRPDEDALEAIFAAGAAKARAITSETMADVRMATGVGPRTRVPAA